MNILIPMAGAGSRFADAGYKQSKPLIPVTHLKTVKTIPMVVAAAMDVPFSDESKLIFIDRDFHKDAGIHEVIRGYFKDVDFITINYLTEGQAATCMLAKDLINNDTSLFIGACDNGIILEQQAFADACTEADVLIITHTNDFNIEANPLAHSWVKLADNGVVERMSIKQTVSNNFMNDHATTGMFWFKHGADFIRSVEAMIAKKDITGGEYYVDQAINYAIGLGLKVKFFDVTYLCWGTPENYENTIKYWTEFIKNEVRL